MGYTTDFSGVAEITPKLKQQDIDYIQAFNEIRHMRRDVDKLKDRRDDLRKAAGLPLGHEGVFYVGSAGKGDFGQSTTDDIIDNNTPPGQFSYDCFREYKDYWEATQKAIDEGKCAPGLWCQWTVNDEGTELMWDEGEKFYEYINWMRFLINNFFQPWGYYLNGEIKWQGEEVGDVGKIMIKNNVIGVVNMDGKKEYYEPVATYHDTKEIGE